MMESGKVFDGWDIIKFFKLIMDFKSRSFSTAWSSARSRTQLIEETTEEEVVV